MWNFSLHDFFISNIFISNVWLKLEKIRRKLSNTLRLNFRDLKIFFYHYPRYHPKIMKDILKNNIKNKCVCLNNVIWLMKMKMRLKMKNRSQINRPRPRHGHNYTRYKISLCIKMVICIKQYLSNIWSSIREKIKQHWVWVKKRVAHKKSVNCVFSYCQNVSVVFEETNLLFEPFNPHIIYRTH